MCVIHCPANWQAEQLQQALEDGLDPSQVRVVRAPCMGRCDTAPVLEIGHKHIDHATPEKVNAVIAAGDFHAEILITKRWMLMSQMVDMKR